MSTTKGNIVIYYFATTASCFCTQCLLCRNRFFHFCASGINCNNDTHERVASEVKCLVDLLCSKPHKDKKK